MLDNLKKIDNLPTGSLAMQELFSMGYIDPEGRINEEGKYLLEEVYAKDRVKKAKPQKKEYNIDFLKWWDAYPRTSAWGDYLDSRTLRVNKSGCEKLFLSLLKEYTVEELINGLKYEIAYRKDESRLKKENAMMYMQSTEPYLNQFKEKAIIYVEKAKKGKYIPRGSKKQDNSVVIL